VAAVPLVPLMSQLIVAAPAEQLSLPVLVGNEV
jgi:hypothetical protein